MSETIPPDVPVTTEGKKLPEDDLELVESPPAAGETEQGIRSRHRFILGLSLMVVVAAPILEVVGNQEQVAFRWAPDEPLPESCQMKKHFNIGCPGCGLTRSTVYFFQGQLRNSWDMNPVGPLMVIAILLQIPYRLRGLYGPSSYPLGRVGPKIFGWILTLSLCGNWLWKLYQER